jgi:hypothetical protein
VAPVGGGEEAFIHIRAVQPIGYLRVGEHVVYRPRLVDGRLRAVLVQRVPGQSRAEEY